MSGALPCPLVDVRRGEQHIRRRTKNQQGPARAAYAARFRIRPAERGTERADALRPGLVNGLIAAKAAERRQRNRGIGEVSVRPGQSTRIVETMLWLGDRHLWLNVDFGHADRKSTRLNFSHLGI